jgi:hypothetical protein
MSEHQINDLGRFALFLPFSCNERRQVGASASKQNRLEVIVETRERGAYRESATTCKPLQIGPSQGSGPGGLWFEIRACRSVSGMLPMGNKFRASQSRGQQRICTPSGDMQKL